jgi:glycosyltransferase involved in cell wall biosynthesis
MRVSNGVNTSFYAPDNGDRKRMRAKLGFASDSVIVGFSGRLDPIKNLELLVKVFACCSDVDSRLQLLIVGDGPERDRLGKICCEKSIENRVVFAGQQENILSYLRAMDIFLLTSMREQMPMAILEAMAVGVPVVATNVGEIPYIIDDGINGFVLSSDAPIRSFVDSIFALTCVKRRWRMGYFARQKVIDEFREDVMLQRYNTIISEVT